MTSMNLRARFATGLACAAFASPFFVACRGTMPPASQAPVAAPPERDAAQAGTSARDALAHVLLVPTRNQTVEGVLVLERQGERVHITGTVTGLTEGLHGFHIHETGDCSAPDATSAGGHFAPEGHPHGSPDDPEQRHHSGDFGNIDADAQGVARVDLWSSLPLLTMGPQYVVGRAFIVHAGKDDLRSQPSGDAGGRVACGVIRQGPSGR